MITSLRATVLFALALGTGGCATVLVGTRQNVTITSEPPGARVTVLPDGETLVTPGDVNLRRKHSHTVCFELEGRQPVNVYVDPLPGGAMYGNIGLGGIIGLLVDMDGGAAFSLRPDPVHVVLEPLPAHATDATS